jgi:hypothetical protein
MAAPPWTSILLLAALAGTAAAALAGTAADAGPAGPAHDAAASARVGQALFRVARFDPLGLGGAAREALAWSAGRAPLRLLETAAGWRLEAGGPEPAERPLPPALGEALARVAEHVARAEQARDRPATTEELRQALTSPAGVEAVSAVFERSLAEPITLADGPIFLEMGGDLLLVDGRPDLRVLIDPTRDTMRQIVSRRADPLAVARLFHEAPDAMALLDEAGQLEREVALWRERTARGMPLERRRRVFDLAIDTALRNAADAIVLDPRAQLEGVIRDPPRGRLVGLWHVHPPAWAEDGLRPGDAPSPDDFEVAASTGRFVTIAFRPDGFDVHDLVATAGVVGEGAPRFEHRSEDWRRRFAEAHARLAPSGPAPQ